MLCWLPISFVASDCSAAAVTNMQPLLTADPLANTPFVFGVLAHDVSEFLKSEVAV